MATRKTQPQEIAPRDYLATLPEGTRRDDAHTLVALMEEVTGEPGRMWGASIIGFGRYQKLDEKGQDKGFFLTGFAPRSQSQVLYIMGGFQGFDDLLGRLGKHKTGKSCLYITRLSQVDMDVLRALVTASVAHMRAKYPDPS